MPLLKLSRISDTDTGRRVSQHQVETLALWRCTSTTRFRTPASAVQSATSALILDAFIASRTVTPPASNSHNYFSRMAYTLKKSAATDRKSEAARIISASLYT